MTNNIDHDLLFKQLLTTFFLEFMDLFAPELAPYIERDSLEFLPQEYFTDIRDGQRKAMDVVVRVTLKGRINQPKVSRTTIIINCEHQSTSEADFNRRLFFYFAQLHREYLEPIYPIALFSYDTPIRKQEPNTYSIDFPDLEVLKFQFRVVQLNKLNWRDFLDRQNPVAAALMAKMKMVPAERAKVKVECLRAIATLKLDPARIYLLSGFVDSYLRLDLSEQVQFEREIDNIEIDTQQEKVMEIVTSWMERGVEREALQLVSRLLNHRVGKLEPSLAESLASLSVAQLEDLFDAAMNFSEVSDLTNWLESKV